MNINVFRLILLGSLFSLSACVQQSEVRQMKHSVSTLNQEMTQLNQETVKITQQNRLNAKSGNDSNLLIVFYVQIMPDDFVMQLHR
ncbi:DUF3251 domain-containing protein, partial [Escherichia coli]|uniref:DUF3251 domain-containing protein n=1 Tax=Escherichia coli TaxID=562 RepID=UPI000E20BDC5